jgi:hypothetical protein
MASNMAKGHVMTAAFLTTLLTIVGAVLGPAGAGAQTIVDKWTSVSAPPAPQLKPVTVDPKTTALLMLDFMNQNCGKRPACVASLPGMKKLLMAVWQRRRWSTASSQTQRPPT